MTEADGPVLRHCVRCDEDGHTPADQHCSMCGVYPARHKIGEEGWGSSAVHNLTNYLCCAHFMEVVGDCSTLPTFGHCEDYPGLFTEPEWMRR